MLAPVFRSSTLTRDEDIAVRCMLRRGVAASGRPRSGGERPGAHTGHPARDGVAWTALGAMAVARPSRIGPRRPVSSHRPSRSRAASRRSWRTTRGPLASLTTSSVSVIARLATSRSSGSTSARRRPRLHAAGDRRHLALVHSLSSISLAQLGRYDEAMTALRHAERLASIAEANDVLATVCGNQAGVMMLQHRYDQGLRAGGAQRRPPRGARLESWSRGLPGYAWPDPRSSRRPDPGSRCAPSRARRAKPHSIPRNHGRRLRHAGTDRG